MVSGEIDEGVAQFDRFSSQQANGPMVVASWNGTTRNGDEMGCLSTRQGEAEALLSLVVEHSLQPSFQVHLSHTDGGVAADVEGVANLLVAPAFGGFEQDPGARKGAGIGFARMDERLERGSLAFGQGDWNGMLHDGSPAFSSSSHSCQYQNGLTTSSFRRGVFQRGGICLLG